MITELPPPPAPLVARLEASFPLPAELAPYEYLWASEGETAPAGVPVRQLHGEDAVNPVPADVLAARRRPAGTRFEGHPLHSTFGVYAQADPIHLLLDRLGIAFRMLFQKVPDKPVTRKPATGSSLGGEPGGIGDPVPPGDPIPVDGGGKPPGG